MAQYVLQDMVNKKGVADKFYIDSAATSYEEIGHGVHPGTRNKLSSVGIPCGKHKARRITKQDYSEFDYIIGMDTANINKVMPENKKEQGITKSEKPRKTKKCEVKQQ